jgi:hypothetical protein
MARPSRNGRAVRTEAAAPRVSIISAPRSRIALEKP